MAEENPPTTTEKPKNLALKTLLLLGGVLVIEVITIVVAFMIAGGSADVEGGVGTEPNPVAIGMQPVEILVVQDRFASTLRGRTFLYDTEVFIKTLKKFQDQIEQDIKNMEARIRSDIAAIFRRAEPSHLLEPELATLKRQILAAFDKRFGYDEDGKSYVQAVEIPRCTPFRADL